MISNKSTWCLHTFTEVFGAQEVDSDDENDNDRDVNWQVVELISDDQPPTSGKQLPKTHVTVPVCNQDRGGSDFPRNTNGSGLENSVSILRQSRIEMMRGRT
jgi:hypothetical protein